MKGTPDPRRGAVLVVGVDFRARSQRAVAHALGMLGHGIAREVHLLHVLEGERAADRALRACVPDAVAQLALDVGGRALDGRRGAAWAHVRSGVAVYELRRLAFDVGADLIVVGERTVTRADERTSTGDRDPLAPFSVLVAGREIVLESRGFECARCEHCERIRALPGEHTPWCTDHLRPDAAAKRIVSGPLHDEPPRVIH